MVVQRVTRNLGLNRSKDREKIFQYIENVLQIKEKYCSRGTSKRKNFDFKHTGPNPLPIRNFNLLGAHINENGDVIIKSRDGLQANCMSCEKKFRRRRINRYTSKYNRMSPKEIHEEYLKNYPAMKGLKKCSRCKIEKTLDEFPISTSMETGLHNTCKACAKSYSESVGNRWIIYSPDGHEVLNIKENDKCVIPGCTSKTLSKDHIFPIAKGGTDNKENLQILCIPHNLSKSDTVISPIIKSVNDIKRGMICERYGHLLDSARKEKWSLVKFESEITKAVREFILWKSNLSDDELTKFFEDEKARNNRKHSVERAVKKFRQYCKSAILEVNRLIIENNKKQGAK